MLGNMGPPLINQLFCSVIIPMWIFVNMLLDRLPAIFDGGEIGRWVAIEVEFQAIWLLPCPYNVWFSRPMTWVTIFFQDEIVVCFNSGLHNWLKNLVNGDSLTHLPVSISRHLIKIYIRFETVAHRSPTMMAFVILLFWFLLLLDTIRTILFP